MAAILREAGCAGPLVPSRADMQEDARALRTASEYSGCFCSMLPGPSFAALSGSRMAVRCTVTLHPVKTDTAVFISIALAVVLSPQRPVQSNAAP